MTFQYISFLIWNYLIQSINWVHTINKLLGKIQQTQIVFVRKIGRNNNWNYFKTENNYFFRSNKSFNISFQMKYEYIHLYCFKESKIALQCNAINYTVSWFDVFIWKVCAIFGIYIIAWLHFTYIRLWVKSKFPVKVIWIKIPELKYHQTVYLFRISVCICEFISKC